MDGKKSEHWKCTLTPHNHCAWEHILAVPNVGVYCTQHLGSFSAVMRCLFLANEQRVQPASLWQCLIIKIPLRCEEALRSLSHLTLVGGGDIEVENQPIPPSPFAFPISINCKLPFKYLTHEEAPPRTAPGTATANVALNTQAINTREMCASITAPL